MTMVFERGKKSFVDLCELSGHMGTLFESPQYSEVNLCTYCLLAYSVKDVF